MRLYSFGFIFVAVVLALAGAEAVDDVFPMAQAEQDAAERETLAAGQEWIDTYLYTPDS